MSALEIPMKTSLTFRVCAVLSLLGAFSACETPPIPCGADEIRTEAGCVIADANCEADQPGSIRTACAQAHKSCFQDALGALCGLCLDGYRAEDTACVAVKSCADLDCSGAQRGCAEAGVHSDAVCGSCLPGTEAINGTCVAPGCDAQVQGSVAQTCQTEKRACVAGAEGPECGQCWSGYTDDLGACRPVKTCQSLGCGAAHRLCAPAGANSDATCGQCATGYLEQNGACRVQANATCDPSPATGSIADGCAAEHRGCVAGTPAQCGGCSTGFVEDPSSLACVPEQGCAQLTCAAENRNCLDTPYGHCTSCVDGYVEDAQTGDCRPARTCAELTCGQGSQCVEGTATTDAVCQTDCAAGSIWNGSRCQVCPSCNESGEDGVWSTPTAGGYCICKTQPGHYYSVGGDVGTFRCDGDNDGWIRESARSSVLSSDPAIAANARCALRTITGFSLINEGGQTKDFPLAVPLAMYESDRNDDDQILQSMLRQRGIPQYGTARDITAAELNRLTKLCFSPTADYNDNGVADTAEWADRALAPSFRPDQAPFNQFSYFAELDRGAFQASANDPSRGVYVIREKQRGADAAVPAQQRVPIAYLAGDEDHWNSCTVRRDPEWNTLTPPIGMDFAKLQPAITPNSWKGMNHHSQFKCVVIENQPDPALPSQLTAAQATAQQLRLNACRATGSPVVASGNPAETIADCSPVDPATAQPGDVLWAAIPFIDYDPYGKWAGVPDRQYVRACVNECAERLPSCPGWDINPVAIDCQYEADNFGKFITCTADEVCDGLDNTGEGNVDEGNPGGGVACSNDGVEYPDGYPVTCAQDSDCAPSSGVYCDEPTGRCKVMGICEPGTSRCDSGLKRVVCDPTITPGSRTETCNGQDDDCDGPVDEGNPGGGVQNCTVAGVLGACANGKLSCQNGSLSQCVQTVQPITEIGCNNVDDDCDGKRDEPPEDGTCPSPWTTYYVDGDSDGYGESTNLGQCRCAADTTYKVTNRTDCCDTDGNAHPGATTWRSSANACGSYDYNCDGSETKTSNTSVSAGCGYRAFSCGGASVGWADSVPACGQTHTWFTNGCGDWAPCPQDKENRTQYCY